MNQMEIFKNPEFGSVRVIEENGKYLFCGLDVTAALGYKDSAKALKAHCTSDGWAFYPLIDNVGRTQQTRFISEGNLYRLIVHSKLPSAERFERWVFDEVLPSIRKHGAYITREKLWEVATSPEAMMKLCSDLLAEREENAALREENAMLEGKHEASPKFQKKLFNLYDKSFFQIAFQYGFVLRHTQKLEHIGITDDVSWLIDFNPFLRQREDLLLVDVSGG